MHPFVDAGPLELISNRQDSSIFCFGNDQKKRPNNFTMGRLYASHILDMFEFEVQDFLSLEQVKSKDGKESEWE